ncbi:SDR family oxidoreductase [Glaciihabitans sp. INWT7]|uniref:SDR family oxidoreductase n=1 Tax=Glaciihabitans sp. INWT7 TaxID=2596912 RepID=UPI0016292D9F|nr:SDR family oxidoreductase [Glaciihabitans sp. INWT7]QNE46775.1 SDR family oxidoreductase [Glaciihabitans sp. INWT7]
MTVIAITGSTGHVGGLVARQLADLSPTLVVRDAAKAPSIAGSRVVVTDYGDAANAVRALEGVDVLFMVSAAESKFRRVQHRTFIEAAAAAGVQHIVYTSFFGADPQAVFTLGRDHADAEAAIRGSGMDFTLLRDNFYSDLLPFFADDSGVIRGPAGEGRVSAVARADVADVAATILRVPGDHSGVTYHLTGPEALTLAEVATRAGTSIGRDLSYAAETVTEAYESRSHYGAEQWQLDAWISTYTAIAEGETERVTDHVERVTGNPARTIEQALAG